MELSKVVKRTLQELRFRSRLCKGSWRLCGLEIDCNFSLRVRSISIEIACM